jgi:hypothetical protein
MNMWRIPEPLEKEVRARDRNCVYCGVEFTDLLANDDKKRNATWEHFDNDRWDDSSIMALNVALCCNSCNSSKGTKQLREWFSSTYCRERNINEKTVARVVKRFLKMFP